MLESEPLREYMSSFYGYGSYSAKWWVIGMEEGGGGTEQEVQSRVDAWIAEGRKELCDVRSFHVRTGLDRWFQPNPPIQRTWGMLLRMLLAIDGKPTDTPSVREFQGERLGRIGGEVNILELLPLPSPGKNQWNYHQWTTDMPVVASRQAYELTYRSCRSKHIHNKILEHAPQLVVFYSFGDKETWANVTGVTFEDAGGFYTGTNGKTLFVVTPHPVSYGMTNCFFEDVGRQIAERLKST